MDSIALKGAEVGWLCSAARVVLLAAMVSSVVAGECRAQRVSVAARPAISITSLDAEGTEPLGRVASAVFDSRDRVILADASLSRIVAYDEHGVPRLSSGRDGVGPGEYSLVDWAGVCLPGDSVVVYDYWRHDFSVLDPELVFVRRSKVVEEPSSYVFTCDTLGNVYYLAGDLKDAPANSPAWRGDADLKRLDLSDGSVTTVVDHQPMADLMNVRGGWLPDTHGRRTSLSAFKGNVLVSTGESDGRVLHPVADGAPRPLRAVPWPAIEPTDATRHAVAAGIGNRMKDVAVATAIARMMLGAPRGGDIDVFYNRVLIDPFGTVWTQRSLPGEPEVRLEMESLDGKHLGSVTLPVNGDMLAVGKTRLAVLSELGDAPAVLVYAIERVP